jgi:hypothetical protein
MDKEIFDVEAFANSSLRAATAGVRSDSTIPAMTTPTVAFTPTAAQYVVAGSTICLVC